MAKKGLGKGLGALIQNTEEDEKGVIEIDINKIEPNKNQPRKHFEKEAIEKLAESIKEYGVVQPLIVNDEKGYYSIVAGERRWRASRVAGIKTVPVIIKNYSPLEILEIALIENIQRQDLNPIEEAQCYKKLIDEFYLTQDDISKKVSKSRSYISRNMKLLGLDERVQNFIIEDRLSVGHGVNLLLLDDKESQYYFADKIIDEDISVKQGKALIEEFINRPKEEDVVVKKSTVHVYKGIEEELKTALGTKVNIKDKNNKGKIELEYYSKEELERLYAMLKKLSE